MATPGLGPGPSAAAADGGLRIGALQDWLQGATGRQVRLIETHVSWVLLDGEHAWKLKKPLNLGFLDFSTPAARRRACREELRLNRRLAPRLYLDVVPVRGSPTQPRLDAGGPVIDHALRMRQFPDEALLSRRLADGRLDGGTLDRLAARLASFHQQAPRAPADGAYGAPAQVLGATAQVLAALARQGADPRLAALAAWCAAEGRRLRRRFAARRRGGWVREVHGDLHLDNLVEFDDEVTAFDGLEFDASLRWIDVQADIAFACMDLHAHGRSDLAWRLLDGWLEGTGDHAGMAVHRYYMVYRALVRALVLAMRRSQGAAHDGVDYLAAATRLAQAGQARLLITRGPSGSGKSRLALALVEAAGAVRLRSDVERKRLFGLEALQASDPRRAYTDQATRRTYAALRRSARAVLAAGYPVIVDAAFLEASRRDAFAALARSMGLSFTLLDCHADPALLRERVSARLARGDDPSEADLRVLQAQLDRLDTLRPGERALCIDVDTGAWVDAAAIAARWNAMGRRAPPEPDRSGQPGAAPGAFR
jgi:aminoglycoside phosphotransferase family enzyme/gluconate kinase